MAAKIIPDLKDVKFEKEILDCEACIQAKAKQKPCVKERSRAVRPLQRLHSDLMGPLKPSAFRTGAKYIVTMIDDYSRFMMAYPVMKKTQVHMAMKPKSTWQ